MDQEFIPAPAKRTAPPMELANELTDRLTGNQRIRTMITDQLTDGGTTIPNSEEGLKMLLQNMREQDAVTLGEMKVKVDASSRGNEEVVRAALLELSRTRGHLPAQPTVDPTAPRRVIAPSPELEMDIDTVPDQDLIGQQNLNYDDFRERFAK